MLRPFRAHNVRDSETQGVAWLVAVGAFSAYKC
jgi:hypothetical protein